jgi:AraC-like DNA-binding protein
VQYARYVPGPPLSRHVAYLWSLRDAAAHATERIVPSGTLELVVNLHEDALAIHRPDAPPDRYAGALVSGAYRRFFAIDTRAHASIVGVHFRPGGAGAVLGLPPGELADQHVELASLWGSSATELRERLCTAATTAERFSLLESSLLSRLRDPADRRDGHRAVPFALEQLAQGATVRDVVASVQLSWRRLIEVFTAEVGIAPKRMSRVLRFERACRLARRPLAPDWARIAQLCGYFDQSHLIHDMRQLTGFSPAQIVAASAQVKEHHVAVPEGVKFLQARAAARR